MNIRPKTIRRLLIIVLVCVAVVTGGMAIVRHNDRVKEAAIVQAGADGMKAFKEGDYATALARLGTYVAKHKDDADALYAYAISRSRVEEISGRHITEAIMLLDQYRSMRPNDANANHELLDLYAKADRTVETMRLADEMLQQNPKDIKALLAKSRAMLRTGDYEGALKVSQQINSVAPLDLQGQLLTMELLTRLKRPPADVVKSTADLQKAHPNDPRFELLMGVANEYAGDHDEALKWFKTAATRTPPDADFVRALSRYFEALGRFDASQALLEKASKQSTDPQIRRVLVQRLWQSNKFDEALNWLKDLDLKTADSDLLAFRALCLYATDKREEASNIVAALKQRKGDNSALAWAQGLAAHFDATPDQDKRALITKYQNALNRDRDNAVIRAWVGDAYSGLGETELAIQEWRTAAELSPSWATPCVLWSRSLLATGRTKDALDVAVVGFKRSPNFLPADIALASAWFKYSEETPDPNDAKKLMDLVTEIQRNRPGEPETLPIYIALLARSGQRDHAIELLRKALLPENKLSIDALMRLAAVSQAEKLGLEHDILARAQSTEPHTPRSALMQAAAMASAGKAQEGLAYLQKSAVNTGDEAVQWKLAIAQFRESIKDPDAKADWIALGDAYPNNIAVQNAILTIGLSARSDRDFTSRTIDRVKALTGEEGHLWRQERARWLLGSPNKDRDSAEAVAILTDLVRAYPSRLEWRLLLVQGLENIGQYDGAIDHLKQAVSLDSNVPAAPLLELVRLLQMRNRLSDAKPYLDRLAKMPALTTDERRQLAAQMVRQGDTATAADMLKNTDPAKDPGSALMLAELSRRRGDVAQADAIYTKLLASDAPSLEAIVSAADFYASQQRTEQANAALAKLQDNRFTPIQRELALAAHEERYVSTSAAAQRLAALTQSMPSDPEAWRQLISFDMRHDDFKGALAAGDAALEKLPGNSAILAMRDESSARMKAAANPPDYQPLIDILSRDPNRAAEKTLFEALRDSRASSGEESTQRLITRLEKATQDYPRALPLYALLVEKYFATNQPAQATQVAERAMNQMPTDPEAAHLAVSAQQLANSPLDVKRCAEVWRQRTLDHPMAADLAIAEALISLKQPDDAYAQVKPYLQGAIANPDHFTSVLNVAARALVAQNKAADAQAMLEPMLAKSSGARNVWLRIASTELPDDATAAAWMSKVEPLTPADSVQEQTNLITAWMTIGQRTGAKSAFESAQRLLKNMSDQPDPKGDLAFMLASINEQMGESAAAESGYRQVLAQHPNHSSAQNDLAYFLLIHNKNLQEAESLVRKAIQTEPKNASYYDTLARILAKKGDIPGALQTFDQAISLNPASLEALIGKASTLQATGKKDEASRLLTRIDSLLARTPILTAPVKAELQSLRQSLSRSE
jgi:tetratricopeptide (TPR) repeat protein